MWQANVEADREPTGFLGAPVGRLHDPGPAAGDHRPAGAGELASDLARQFVEVPTLSDSCRAEDRDRRPVDLVDGVEAASELGGDHLDVAFLLSGDAGENLSILESFLALGH